MEISNYEFNASENESIRKLINHMMVVSIFLIILGALFTVYGIYNLVGTDDGTVRFIFDIVMAVVLIVMGWVTINSARSFRLVVRTEGNDIENLMNALDKLTTWFSIQTTMIIVGTLILILGFLNSVGVF